MTADSWGIDERQPVLEQRAGRGDLDPQHLAPAGLRGPAQVGLDVGHRDLDDLGLFAVTARDDQVRGGVLAVGDHRREHGALVVADPCDRHVQQRVEQLALALLELAGDHHPDLRVGDAVLGPGQPLDQIAALVRVGDLGGVVDQLDDDLDLSGRLAGRDLAGVVGLRHGVLCLIALVY